MHVFKYGEMATTDPDEGSEVSSRGIQRKVLAQGERGFFLNSSWMPSGLRIEPHRHNENELIIVLEGGCALDNGTQLRPFDAVVIPSGETYGFTVGDDGMRFAVIRMGEASIEFAKQ
jgi:quercetin dioxygenase-like cupin family protein